MMIMLTMTIMKERSMGQGVRRVTLILNNYQNYRNHACTALSTYRLVSYL